MAAGMTALSSAKAKKLPYIDQGMALLQRARAEKFRSALTLQQAYQALRMAMAQTPALPEPYLAMSYLLLVTGDGQAAHLLLHELLRIAPDNQDALRMLAYLSEHPDKVKRSGRTNLNLDELYDEVEDLSVKYVHYYLQGQEEITVENAHKTIFKKLSTVTKKIEDYINALEREFDVTNLQMRLHPLHVLARRQDKMAKVATQLQTLQAEIREYSHLTIELIEKLESENVLSDNPPNIEYILDKCDLIADHLDLLDEQGHNITQVTNPYRALIKKVSLLQELID